MFSMRLAGIFAFRQRQRYHLSWPRVDLRFCPWLLMFKYWRGGPDLTGALLSVPITCISSVNQWVRGSFLLTNDCQRSVLRYMEGCNPRPKAEFLVILCTCVFTLRSRHLRLTLGRAPLYIIHMIRTERRTQVRQPNSIFEQNGQSLNLRWNWVCCAVILWNSSRRAQVKYISIKGKKTPGKGL